MQENYVFCWPPAGLRKAIAIKSAHAVKCAFRNLRFLHDCRRHVYSVWEGFSGFFPIFLHQLRYSLMASLNAHSSVSMEFPWKVMRSLILETLPWKSPSFSSKKKVRCNLCIPWILRDIVLEFEAWTKLGSLSGWNFDGLSGTRISPLCLWTKTDYKSSEAWKSDVLTVFETGSDTFHQGVKCEPRFSSWEAREFRDRDNEGLFVGGFRRDGRFFHSL